VEPVTSSEYIGNAPSVAEEYEWEGPFGKKM
jgi:hypothetical protein